MRDQMQANPDKGYVVDCLVVSRRDEGRPLFQGHADNMVTARSYGANATRVLVE